LAIIERTPEQCFDKFTAHVRKLWAATVSKTHFLATRRKPGEAEMTLSFWQGDEPTTAPIKTKAHGTVYFYLGQLLKAEREAKAYRLTTHKYWYKLQSEPALDVQPRSAGSTRRNLPRESSTADITFNSDRRRASTWGAITWT
jgi:hypothetical protein